MSCLINPFVFAVGGSSFAAFDPATVSNVSLSNGNLTVSHGSVSGTNVGARTPPASGKSTGKYNFEVTIDTLGGGNYGLGVATQASTYSNLGNSATSGVMLYNSGAIWVNGSPVGGGIGQLVIADVYQFNIDKTNNKFYVRKVFPSVGGWNISGTGNPTAGTGGYTIPAGLSDIVFTDNTSSSGGMTLNTGASAFIGTLTSGYTAGWPA